MEQSSLILEAVYCLKECFKWKNDSNSTVADKMFISLYTDFIKISVLPKSEKAMQCFEDFSHDFKNLKIEGKMETWIEEGLENKADIKPELEKKIAEIKEYLKQKNQVVTSHVHTYINPSEKHQKDEKTTEQQTETEQTEEKNLEEDNEDLYSVREKGGKVLIPWDFSEKAHYALQHALTYSRHLGGQINLVHIVKKEKDINEAIYKLNQTVEDIYKMHGIKPEFIVKEGTIFDTITEVASQTDALFVVMGTHGMKGMQKFTGSWALKVIVGTKCPFIVVQQPPVHDKMQKILLPVDHTKESKQKLKQARFLAEHYKNIKVEICRVGYVSSQLFERLTSTNVNYIRSFFRQTGIEHEVIQLPEKDLAEGVVKYAAKSRPDMILILTTKNINISDFVMGPGEQKIIFNEAQIPVMCINPLGVVFSRNTAT